jgi:hypothetical protein
MNKAADSLPLILAMATIMLAGAARTQKLKTDT